METQPKCSGTSTRTSRFEQSIKSVQKLKAELSRARARVQQEAKLEEKRKRYAERHRVSKEQFMLGRICQTVGLDSFRTDVIADDGIPQIDAPLVTGAIALLVGQLRELNHDQVEKLRSDGMRFIQDYAMRIAVNSNKEEHHG